MDEKIYVISCSQDLQSIGMDRIRTAVEGLDEVTVSLDWSRARLVPVVAGEKVMFEEGEVRLLDIRPITVSAGDFVINSMYGVNGMGHLFCVGATEFKASTEDREVNKAMFQSRIRAAVLKGDLLGQVFVIPSR